MPKNKSLVLELPVFFTDSRVSVRSCPVPYRANDILIHLILKRCSLRNWFNHAKTTFAYKSTSRLAAGISVDHGASDDVDSADGVSSGKSH